MTDAKRIANAIRQDRHRRHRREDHSRCLQGHCEDAPTPEELADTLAEAQEASEAAETANADAPPAELEVSGQALWRGTLQYGKLTPSQRALLREMCRMVDRTDWLDAQIEANRDDLGSVKWMLREARQQAIAMKGIQAELRASGAVGGRVFGDPGDNEDDERQDGPVSGGGGPGIADITARIAERIAQASG